MNRGESTHFDCISLMELSKVSDVKMEFSDQLSKIQTFPKKVQLLILGDIRASMGADNELWPSAVWDGTELVN